MAFDPCGTRRLEGNDILNRIAKYLDVDPMDLAIALKFQAELANAARLEKEKQNGN